MVVAIGPCVQAVARAVLLRRLTSVRQSPDEGTTQFVTSVGLRRNRKGRSQMKLRDALFREPSLAFQVMAEDREDDDDFNDWDLQPLSGATLAAEDVDDIFEGLFIIAAQIVSKDAAPRPCYMDLVLPERIAEHHFAKSEQVTRPMLERGDSEESRRVLELYSALDNALLLAACKRLVSSGLPHLQALGKEFMD